MNYWLLLIPFIYALIVLVLFPKLVDFAKKKDFVDEAKNRKRHEGRVPPVGGWLVYIAFIVAQFSLFPINIQNIVLLISGTLLFSLGLIDDKYPLTAPQKFLGQFIVAGLIVFIAQIHVAQYLNMFGVPIIAGQILCMVAIVFVINSFNLVDGINGLAALLGVAALISFGLWLYIGGKYDYVVFVLTIFVSLTVFLRFNLFDTKAFLGDNGSMLIGFIAAYLAIIFINTFTLSDISIASKCSAEIGIVYAALAIPVSDTLRLFILRPYYLKKSPFKADRNHVHHLLLRLGFNHAEASLVLFGFAIFLVIVSLPVQDLGSLAVILIVLFLSMAFMMSIDYFLFSKYKRKINKKTMFNSLQNLSRELNYPIFVEYAMAVSFFVLAMAIPFHRVSTSIPTLLLLFSFLMLLVRTLIVYRFRGWELIYTNLKVLLKHQYTILLLFNFMVILINIIMIPTAHWTKITLYLLPLVYWVTVSQLEKIIEIKPRFLLSAYIIGLAGFGVFILLMAFSYFPLYGWNSFFYKNLLFHVKANPVTHSLYYNLGILFIGNNFRHLKQERWRTVFWGLITFFVFMVVLCSSKIGLIVLPISLSFTLYNIIRNKKTAIWAVAICIILYSFIFVQGGLLSKEFLLNTLSSRLMSWNESFVILKEHWLSGIGVGNSVSYLKERFELLGYSFGVVHDLNAQNQFIETFLELGIMGFFSVILIFSYSFIKAFILRNKLYFFYIVIILIYMFFESLFQTQMGMIAFAFFNALFMSVFANNSDRTT